MGKLASLVGLWGTTAEEGSKGAVPEVAPAFGEPPRSTEDVWLPGCEGKGKRPDEGEDVSRDVPGTTVNVPEEGGEPPEPPPGPEGWPGFEELMGVSEEVGNVGGEEVGDVVEVRSTDEEVVGMTVEVADELDEGVMLEAEESEEVANEDDRELETVWVAVKDPYPPEAPTLKPGRLKACLLASSDLADLAGDEPSLGLAFFAGPLDSDKSKPNMGPGFR